MSTNSPIQDANIRKALEEDFKTIFQRQLAIAESGTYVGGGKQISTRKRMGGGIGQRTGTLRSHLAAARFNVTGGDVISLVTDYPVYIRFLDMKRKGNFQIYNRQIWGVVYNSTLAKVREEYSEGLRDTVRTELEQALSST